MKNILITALACLALATGYAGDGKILLEDITGGAYYADNMRSMETLDGDAFVQISPQGARLVQYAFSTGKETGTLFDIADTSGESIDAFQGYEMSPDGRRILIVTQRKPIYRHSFTAEYFVYQRDTKKLLRLSLGGPQQAPVWAPDGSKVAFVRDNDIFVADLVKGSETQVTHDGEFGKIINGIPDWVNEEEFGFSHAMAFSKDGKYLAWIRYDESKVETYSLQLFKGMRPEMEEYADYPGEYAYKYPKAGHDNAVVSAWRYNIETKETIAVKLPLDSDGYIPRILTGIDSHDIILYTLNRHQDDLRIYQADAESGQCSLLLSEKADKYVKEDVLDAFRFTADGIFMLSDRSGFLQVYQYDNKGKLLRQVTHAEYGVTDVYGYDEKGKTLYYQAAGRSPMEREVYAQECNGKAPRCLTPQRGWNKASFASDYRHFVATWSDFDHPFQCAVYNRKGKKVRQVVDNADLSQKIAQLDLPSKEMFSFDTSEGVSLNGFMVKPPHFSPDRKYPVVMFQYSGPGSQQVVNSWSVGSMGQGGMFDLYLAQQGFIVVIADGRGTGGRGSDFEKCTYLHLGEKEAHDQVETALYLASLPYVDADNIGIWGWSYGGFCTLMSMSEGRGVFKAGVAVAPPTNWKFYDSIYTERFMRTPGENPEGYNVNPITWAPQLHGQLLVCHGMADDNVHPQNSFEYAEALVQADKDFRQLFYTNRNHSIYGGNTRHHLLRQIAQFFCQQLQ